MPDYPGRKFSFSLYDRQHIQNLLKQAARIDKIFKDAISKGTKIGEATGFSDPNGEFLFDKFPAIKERAEKFFKELHDNLLLTITNGNREEWLLSAAKNEAMVNKHYKRAIKKFGQQAEEWTEPHMSALKEFNERVQNGMNLSDRVWNLTTQFKQELELALEMGLGDGKSAAVLTKDVRQYLNEPNKLFRRVRDEKGVLRLSKAAQAYHPGRGVYRSSYKNALRLTATENNMAYRTADHQRWAKMDFVTGIQIKLSNNHTCNGHVFFDICDQLKGEYPKSFKFVGWHPFCRCIAVPKLADEDEFIERQQALIDGEMPPDGPYEGEVTEMPANFENWVEENAEKIDTAKSVPYFIKDNRAAVNNILNPTMTTQEKAALRQSQRSQADIDDIKARWEQKLARDHKTMSDANRVLAVAKTYPEVDYSEIEKLIAERNLKALPQATQDLLAATKAMRAEERALGDIIPDVHDWHKQFSIKELKEVKSNVLRTLGGMPTDPESRIDKLRFEIRWVEDHKKYKTWEVAQKSYQKELTHVERKFEEAKLVDSLSDAFSFIPEDAKKAKEYAKKAFKLRKMLSTPGFDIAKAKTEAEAFKKLYLDLSNTTASAVMELPAPTKMVHETLKDLKERLGDNLPKTLPNLDKAIKQYEKTIQYGKNAKEHKAEIEELMRKVFDEHDLGMNIPANVADSILESWFKNTFEVGTSGGYKGSSRTSGPIETSHARLGAAHQLFGLPKDLANKQLQRHEYEKYGNLLDHDILSSIQHNTATQYGRIEVRFKKDKVIATWTAGDSLCLEYQPSLVSDPKSCSFDDFYRTPTTSAVEYKNLAEFKKNHIERYLELQYHGDLTLDCVESITFPDNLDDPSEKTMLARAKKWKQKGIKVYFVGEDERGNDILKQL